MTSQMFSSRLGRDSLRSEPITLPDGAVRLVAALLALGIAAVHVADQGGLTAFIAPDWLGWSYRLIEVGGVLTAVALLLSGSTNLGWAVGVLLGVGPFLGYLASRTVGVPGDPGDIGNWGDWVGTVALVVEAGLVTVSVGMLLARRRRWALVAAQLNRGAELPDVVFDQAVVYPPSYYQES